MKQSGPQENPFYYLKNEIHEIEDYAKKYHKIQIILETKAIRELINDIEKEDPENVLTLDKLRKIKTTVYKRLITRYSLTGNSSLRDLCRKIESFIQNNLYNTNALKELSESQKALFVRLIITGEDNDRLYALCKEKNLLKDEITDAIISGHGLRDFLPRVETMYHDKEDGLKRLKKIFQTIPDDVMSRTEKTDFLLTHTNPISPDTAIKSIAHVLGIEDMPLLWSTEKSDFEKLYTSIGFDIVANSFKEYVQSNVDDPISKQEYLKELQWISKSLSLREEAQLDALEEQYILPILADFSTPSGGHAIGLGIFKHQNKFFLIYTNTGAGSEDRPGSFIFEIDNKKIKALFNFYETNNGYVNAKSFNELLAQLEPILSKEQQDLFARGPVYPEDFKKAKTIYLRSKMQKRGDCTETNNKKQIKAYLFLAISAKLAKGKQLNYESLDFDQIPITKELYKHFTQNFHRNKAVENLIELIIYAHEYPSAFDREWVDIEQLRKRLAYLVAYYQIQHPLGHEKDRIKLLIDNLSLLREENPEIYSNFYKNVEEIVNQWQKIQHESTLSLKKALDDFIKNRFSIKAILPAIKSNQTIVEEPILIYLLKNGIKEAHLSSLHRATILDLNNIDKKGTSLLSFAIKEELAQDIFEFALEHVDSNPQGIELGDIDINQPDQQGKTALGQAMNKNNKHLVTLLVRKGAKATKTDLADASSDMQSFLNFLEEGTPLHQAAKIGDLEAVQALLKKKADIAAPNSDGDTALHLAAKKGHLDIVKILIENEANVAATNSLGWTALHLAANNGRLDVVKILIENGANVATTNPLGWTALHLAANNGRLDVVQVLLENKADIASATSDLWGSTALHLATEAGYFNVVQLLLEKGANIEATNKFGATALYEAAMKGHPNIVQLLLEKGANIAVTDSDGKTALHLAAEKGNVEVVKVLLAAKADVTLTDKFGNSALDLAKKHGHQEIMQILLKAQQKLEPKKKPESVLISQRLEEIAKKRAQAQQRIAELREKVEKRKPKPK